MHASLYKISSDSLIPRASLFLLPASPSTFILYAGRAVRESLLRTLSYFNVITSTSFIPKLCGQRDAWFSLLIGDCVRIVIRLGLGCCCVFQLQ